jgi:hypothetical protein
MGKRPYNVYKSLGCSQEMHLPNCGHFGESGVYLSKHAQGCPGEDSSGPCWCNPDARRKARRAEQSLVEKLILKKRYLGKLSYEEAKKLAKFILKYIDDREKVKRLRRLGFTDGG